MKKSSNVCGSKNKERNFFVLTEKKKNSKRAKKFPTKLEMYPAITIALDFFLIRKNFEPKTAFISHSVMSSSFFFLFFSWFFFSKFST